MDADGVLVRRRLEIAVELALPDAVHFRWTDLQRGWRRHCLFLPFVGQSHGANAPWSRFPSMGGYVDRVRNF